MVSLHVYCRLAPQHEKQRPRAGFIRWAARFFSPGRLPLSMAVNTESHHEVLLWVKTQTAEGNLKHCIFLEVDPSSTLVNGKRVFIPKCRRQSFEWNVPHTPRQDLDILAHSLHSNPISCPKHCVNYSSRRKFIFFRRLSNLRSILVPLDWFAKLPWQTQFLLVALVILLVAPRWVPQLVNLFNAIHGK